MDNLRYYTKSQNKIFDFSNISPPNVLFRNIYLGISKLDDEIANYNNFLKEYQSIPTKGSSEERRIFRNNIRKLENLNSDVLDLFINKTIIPLNQPSKSSEESEESEELETESEQEGQGLKIMSPNQMLQRLPILLAQVKAGNNSKDLLNEIRQIVYYLYRTKNITKKIYNSIIK